MLLAFLPALPAQDDSKDKQGTPKEQFEALKKEMDKAREADIKALQSAKTDEERRKGLAAYLKTPEAYVGKALELAEKNPKDPAAFDALVWIAENGGTGPVVDKAADLLAKEPAAKLARVLPSLQRSPAQAPGKVLRTIVEKGTDDDLRAKALAALSGHMEMQSQIAQQFKLPDADKPAKATETYFEDVLKKYGDNAKLRKVAEDELFPIRHLSVGKPAPEIEGEDIDGKPFKLSEYRGKVVLLDFWGNW
jgi:hypothetical protein